MANKLLQLTLAYSGLPIFIRPESVHYLYPEKEEDPGKEEVLDVVTAKQKEDFPPETWLMMGSDPEPICVIEETSWVLARIGGS